MKSSQQLRLEFGEMTASEVRLAKAIVARYEREQETRNSERKLLHTTLKAVLDKVPTKAESGDVGMVFVEMTKAEWQKILDATKEAKAVYDSLS